MMLLLRMMGQADSSGPLCLWGLATTLRCCKAVPAAVIISALKPVELGGVAPTTHCLSLLLGTPILRWVEFAAKTAALQQPAQRWQFSVWAEIGRLAAEKHIHQIILIGTWAMSERKISFMIPEQHQPACRNQQTQGVKALLQQSTWQHLLSPQVWNVVAPAAPAQSTQTFANGNYYIQSAGRGTACDHYLSAASACGAATNVNGVTMAPADDGSGLQIWTLTYLPNAPQANTYEFTIAARSTCNQYLSASDCSRNFVDIYYIVSCKPCRLATVESQLCSPVKQHVASTFSSI